MELLSGGSNLTSPLMLMLVLVLPLLRMKLSVSLLGDKVDLGKGNDFDTCSEFGVVSLTSDDDDVFCWRESGSMGVYDGVCNGASHKYTDLG